MNLDFDELQNGSEITETDISKLEKSCFIDLSEEMPHPEILLSIGQHEYKGRFYDTPVMTAGEFSAIVATSKSKKTFLKSAFLASYIGGKTSILFPNIKSHRDKEYTILDFDTEQGKYYTQRTFRRVIEMVGASNENYKGYATRHLNSRERLLLIDFCLKNQQRYKHPVKMVAIDGIADLVENTNDIIMSKEASDYIMKWTYEYNIHIIAVIHKSTTTNKPLGHLGTYVLKKAETVIDLEIQADKTIKVTNPFSRGYRFDEFIFDVNKDALPYLINDFI